MSITSAVSYYHCRISPAFLLHLDDGGLALKKIICFLAIIGIGSGLYAFDRALNGSWGFVSPEEEIAEEIIHFNFNNDEIRLFNKLFLSDDYREAEDTIYLDDYEGETVMLQYYLLSPYKLLLIMTNLEDSNESVTMILSKF
jgi:hypothetical protein